MASHGVALCHLAASAPPAAPASRRSRPGVRTTSHGGGSKQDWNHVLRTPGAAPYGSAHRSIFRCPADGIVHRFVGCSRPILTSRTCAGMLPASLSPTQPQSGSGLIRPFRSLDTKPPSCATGACRRPAPAKMEKSGTARVSRNESNNRRRRESGIAPHVELSAEAGAWCDKHSAAQMQTPASSEISRCASGRPQSGKQILFACSNSCIRAGTRIGARSCRGDVDAGQELADSLDCGHQVLVGIGDAEAEIAFAIRAERSTAQASHTRLVQ